MSFLYQNDTYFKKTLIARASKEKDNNMLTKTIMRIHGYALPGKCWEV